MEVKEYLEKHRRTQTDIKQNTHKTNLENEHKRISRDIKNNKHSNNKPRKDQNKYKTDMRAPRLPNTIKDGQPFIVFGQP